MRKPSTRPDRILPNFCDSYVIFSMVILSALLAFALSLNRGINEDFWVNFSIYALFCQWIALGNITILCLLDRYLCQRSVKQVLLFTFFLAILLLIITAEMAYQFIGNIWITQQQHFYFLLEVLGIGVIFFTLALQYLYVTHQWRQHIRLEFESRIAALQARIRPHFLFNVLSTLADLVHNDPKKAERSIEDLSELLHLGITGQNHVVNFAKEYDMCRGYLRLEQARLEERLCVQWTIQDIPQDASIPLLTLQPLLENAIYHGIELLSQGGTITVEGRVEDGNRYPFSKGRLIIVLTITNPIVLDPTQRHVGNQMAQESVDARLKLLFQEDYQLAFFTDDDIYQARLVFPYIALS